MKLVVTFLFACLYSLQANSQIYGTVLSDQNKCPVIYATILVLDHTRSGTTTDEKGCFTLQVPDKTNLYISAVGFHDTIVSAHIFKKNNLILKTKVYQLDEVLITPSSASQSILIGLPNALPSNDGWYYLYPGHTQGIYYEPRNKEIDKEIISIRIYISETGKFNTPMGLRIMTCDFSKIKKNERISDKHFYDLLPQLITFTPDKSGWQHIDLTLYDLKVPKTGLLVLLYPLEKGKKYQWTGKDGKNYYGAMIANYSQPFEPYKIASYQPKEKSIYIISSPLIKKAKPMIVIELK